MLRLLFHAYRGRAASRNARSGDKDTRPYLSIISAKNHISQELSRTPITTSSAIGSPATKWPLHTRQVSMIYTGFFRCCAMSYFDAGCQAPSPLMTFSLTLFAVLFSLIAPQTPPAAAFRFRQLRLRQRPARQPMPARYLPQYADGDDELADKPLATLS